MNAIRLQNAIGDIQDTYIMEAHAPASRPSARKWLGVLLAAVLLALSLIACAPMLFSSISGDDLSLEAAYIGNGVVEITVENKSSKKLSFQPTLKLMLWSDGTEIPAHGKVRFANTEIAPNSTGVLTIDLSAAYDMAELEKPIPNDGYYFVLTNHSFAFGQDWMCTVRFSETGTTVPPAYPVQPSSAEADPALIQKVEPELQSFFESSILADKERREEITTAYFVRCTEIILESGKNVIRPVSPAPAFLLDAPPEGTILDNNLPEEMQCQLIGQRTASIDSYAIPIGASPEDTACIFSAAVPQTEADLSNADGSTLPVTYVMVYDSAQARQPDAYAFIRGQLIPFSDLQPKVVYEDDQYTAFNVTDCFFTDLDTQIAAFLQWRTDLFFNDDVEERIQNVYAYLQDAVKKIYPYSG